MKNGRRIQVFGIQQVGYLFQRGNQHRLLPVRQGIEAF